MVSTTTFRAIDFAYHRAMAWIKVPPENHPLFHAALPRDARVQTIRLFGGVAAKVNGNVFAGLFGRSAIVLLPEPHRAEALALDGAGLFDPMGNGRVMSDKVMLPEAVMDDAPELRRWIELAFRFAARLPPKTAKTPAKKKAGQKGAATKPAARAARSRSGGTGRKHKT
jgi:TfoX/Sxy family transcriptional regulator of competence genes